MLGSDGFPTVVLSKHPSATALFAQEAEAVFKDCRD